MYYYIFPDGKIKDCHIDNSLIDPKKKDNSHHHLSVSFTFSVELACLSTVI